MRRFDADALAELLSGAGLVEALRDAFRGGVDAPARHHHHIPVPGAADGTLLLMPAWQAGGHLGVKIVSIFPDNASRGLNSVQGAYLLLDGTTGVPLALFDGAVLTRWRTGAASALAASYLARPDSARLLMVGTGSLAPHLVAAHAAVRPIREVRVWGRRPEQARALAAQLDSPARRAIPVADLEAAVREADVVSCATLAREPLVLVGGFTTEMREADDEAVRRARVYVDTRAGALAEAGDVVQPLRSGILREEDIAGDLAGLARGLCDGRRTPHEITLFKSVGTAVEDLAAARYALERAGS
jgi:alanine dehydrogenase